MLVTLKTGPREISRAEMKAIDQGQERRRLCGSELTAIIALQVGLSLITENLPEARRLMKETGQLGRIAPAVQMIGNGLTRALGKVSFHQLASLTGNMKGTVITVSSVQPRPGDYNIPSDQLVVLARTALAGCRRNCLLMAKEVKACPIRQALDVVPGLRVNQDWGKKLGLCPYLNGEEAEKDV